MKHEMFIAMLMLHARNWFDIQTSINKKQQQQR